MNTMFKVGTVDYTSRIVSGSYQIQTNDLYEEWTDANGRSHRMKYTEKTSGSLDLVFKTLQEYEDFMSNLASVKADDLSVSLVVLDNISSTEKEIDAFIEFVPIRQVDGLFNDRVETVTFNIMEC